MVNKYWKINERVMHYIEQRDIVLASLIKGEGEEKDEIIVNRLITSSERFEVLKRQFWKCNICGCKLKFKKENDWIGEVAHIDHIHPFSKKESYPNGPLLINELSNIQGLCPTCNLKKGSKRIQ